MPKIAHLMGNDISDVLIRRWHIWWDIGYTLIMYGVLNIIRNRYYYQIT